MNFSVTSMNSVVKISVFAIIFAVGWKLLFAPPYHRTIKNVNAPTASEAISIIKKHHERYGSPQIIKVMEHVYVGVGYAVANVILIEGPEGIIVVDTTEAEEVCLQIFEEFQAISTKPLKAIIMTHFHGDHIMGTQDLVDVNKDRSGQIEIIMHSTTAEEMTRYKSSGNIGLKRGARQLGWRLEDGDHIDSGIGPKFMTNFSSRFRMPEPTQTFDQEKDFDIAGVKFTLFHTPGETDDQITVWIPEWKVVMPGDNIYESFPNLYAIRGSPPRDCKHWYESLDKVRRLGAEYMVPSHTLPVSGKENIFDIITHYRDAIQFVYDQTIRWMNLGLEVDEIVEKVRLPPTLARHLYLQPFYGNVSWSVRGVFSNQLGWFDGDPVNLNPLSKKHRARRLAELLSTNFDVEASGVEKLLIKSKECIEKSAKEFNANGRPLMDELQWGLELASMAFKASEGDSFVHEEAKAAMVTALRSLGVTTTNSNARNYYLTSANELAVNLDLDIPAQGKMNIIENSRIDEIMAQFPLRFKAELCDDKELLTIIFEFPDVDQRHGYIMRHCVLEYNTGALAPKKFDAKLIADSKLIKDILVKKRSPIAAYTMGDLSVEGSLLSFKHYMDLIDRDV